MISALVLFFSVHAFGEELKFEAATMKIGAKQIHVRVADNDDRRQRGLMFVKTLAADDGMLFVFDDERDLGFWMKNTLIPLAIGFFDAKGTLVDVQEMVPAASLMEQNPPSYRSRAPAMFALEMNKGWFAKNKLKNGARMRLTGATGSALLKEKLSSAGPSSREAGPSKEQSGD